MSAGLLLAAGLLGGVGALARFLLDGAVAGRLRRSFPYGTLAVNLSGALALGLLVGATADLDTTRLVGGGLLGAYTTFSTWALESHRLAEDGELRPAALNFAVSLALGIAAAWLGREIGMGL
ncbi:MAG: fluoride exporter [Thermoleophilaceae bacterium]|jgi:CrcB protein|nr:fluoride exporter [Thermoleophilaceae bacterium]